MLIEFFLSSPHKIFNQIFVLEYGVFIVNVCVCGMERMDLAANNNKNNSEKRDSLFSLHLIYFILFYEFKNQSACMEMRLNVDVCMYVCVFVFVVVFYLLFFLLMGNVDLFSFLIIVIFFIVACSCWLEYDLWSTLL